MSGQTAGATVAGELDDPLKGQQVQGACPGQTIDETTDAVRLCPACGRHDGLIGLGVRIDHPHRWRRWTTMRTHIYECRACDAIVEVTEVRGSRAKH